MYRVTIRTGSLDDDVSALYLAVVLVPNDYRLQYNHGIQPRVSVWRPTIAVSKAKIKQEWVNVHVAI